MKTLGMIGGMSWESTLPYYRYLNEGVRDRLGGLHSAKLILHSVDFAEVASLQQSEDWQGAGQLLANAAAGLANAGADGIILCTNTMHLVAEQIIAATPLPFLHIVDPTAKALQTAGIQKVGLLGTRFTMEKPFYVEHLAQHYQIECLVPDTAAREDLHRIIFQELCQGMISDTSRQRCKRIVQQLAAMGVEGIILGCTELGLLLENEDSILPLFDTTKLHATAALSWMLSEEKPHLIR
ncbi:aspartate/glutamate racemase family protein [Leeia sp. TBRC 13508]|uniref:Aspartate/glutamate racemase family protein n=1 Tax=Leeia speluncae TaxID=2884804 RepID=A0ABS8D589_9NEIS|nr:aspartate/glutamate racemase family protein [Leeia speluncae]MCB6183131.1 aspartate/glutamate racemase family protein [Leeia speluncae]